MFIYISGLTLISSELFRFLRISKRNFVQIHPCIGFINICMFREYQHEIKPTATHYLLESVYQSL